jgi:hypothetical protein
MKFKYLLFSIILSYCNYAHSQIIITNALHGFNTSNESWTKSNTSTFSTAQKYEGTGSITVDIPAWSHCGIDIDRNWSGYDYLIMYVYTAEASVSVKIALNYGASWTYVESSAQALTQNTWNQVVFDLNSGGVDKSQIKSYT